jgi:tetratricopeptide (TPR) repeat protein
MKYTLAERIITRREPANGRIPALLFREATVIDSTFAMAWRKLGTSLANGGRLTQARGAFIAAFRHRERLPEVERYLAEGLYYDNVVDNLLLAAQAHQRALDVDPNQKSALNNLTFQLNDMGRPHEAIAIGERGIRQPYPYTTQFNNLARAYMAAGRLDDALAMADSIQHRSPTSLYRVTIPASVASHRFDYARVDSIAQAYIATVRNRPTVGHFDLSMARARSLAVRGRVRDADQELQRLVAVSANGPQPRWPLLAEFERARYEADILGNSDVARRRVREALQKWPVDSMDPYDAPLLPIALAHARFGDESGVQHWLQRRQQLRSPEAPFEEFEHQLARARLSMHSRRYAEAAAQLERAGREHYCVVCVASYLGEALALSGNRDAAIEQHRSYLNTPAAIRLPIDAVELPLVYFRLAELLEQRGDRAEAATYYGKFIELWANADAELQPRVTAARERLSSLSGRR